DFGHYSDYKTTYPGLPNQAVELNRNKYFRVNRLELKAGEPKLEMERNPAGGKSFVVYMCLEGALELHCSNGSSGCLSRGRTLLIPAAAGSCLLQCKDAALVLEIFAEC
ncbi:MAG: hypothetical protein WCS66_08745, partial [Bacteroidales bacterium]